ncbi:hypothetical protein AVEN_257673-1 [Araneus ventricosus]|uniref:Uncharacterized protein n=1 Tax=Araneus ventricosus TaxID=182803 RepID=A0A4Y2LHM5_ARAVE|nr:hypothetical protein AVEN_257673-1 [Araneus ventricosus]
MSGLNQFSPNIWHLTQFYQLDEIMRLYHSNRDVDIANKLRLNAIVGDIVLSKAYDSVSGTASQKSKRKALKRVKEFDRTQTGNLEYVIQFKAGAKYMLTYNIDIGYLQFIGLVNGGVGILQRLEYCSVKGPDYQ